MSNPTPALQAAEAAKKWLAKWDKAEWKPAVQFGGEIVRALLAAYQEQAAEVERLVECLEAMNASADILDEKVATLTAERDHARDALAAVREWSVRNGYPGSTGDNLHAILEASAYPDRGAQTEARDADAAVRGVQAWMAADVHAALGRGNITEANDGDRSWADWWARLCYDVRVLATPEPPPEPTDFAEIVRRMRSDHRQIMEDPECMLWTCVCGGWDGGDFDVHRLVAASAACREATGGNGGE